MDGRIKEDIMAYSPGQFHNNYGSMLGALSGLSGGMGMAQSNYYNANNCAQYQSLTAEQLAEQKKLREEEEARVAEEQRKKEELRELNLPKMIRSYVGSLVCLAFAVFFFSMNMSFQNTDYNTSLVSSVMWFLWVISAGSSVLLMSLGRYYSK